MDEIQKNPSETAPKRAIALGFFDGVHPAHRAVLSAAVQAASERHLLAAALTFDRHPAAALQNAPQELLQSLADRVETLKSVAGLREVMILPFDEALQKQDWRDFVRFLVETCRAGFICAGYDFRFGRGAEGTPERLCEEAAKYGIPSTIIPRMDTPAGFPYGSRGLRKLLKEGHAEEAMRYMGRPFSFVGNVLHGKNLGHTLGFPTMNVPIPSDLVLPSSGVYASLTELDGKTYRSVTNVAPDRLSETFVFDFSGDAYGKEIRVSLLSYRRPMKKWAGWEALAEQVERDKADAARWLTENL